LEYQKWITRAIASTVAVAIAFAGFRIYKTLTAPVLFSGYEVEPNNQSSEATDVPFGATVRATIGRRIDSEHSDRDFYRVVVPSGSNLISFSTSALPNMAMCTMIYGDDAELRARFCVGRPNQTLSVDALRLEPGTYFFAILQDREKYEAQANPLVVENISDQYEFRIGPAQPSPEREIEPNDSTIGANIVGPSGKISGKLSWAGDVDVICAPALTPEKQYKWLITDGQDKVRDKGTVLEITSMSGPNAGIATRVHNANAVGKISDEDALSPFSPTPPFLSASPKTNCVSLRLTTDPWTQSETTAAHAGDETWYLRIIPTD
jgi:hypothetical protein